MIYKKLNLFAVVSLATIFLPQYVLSNEPFCFNPDADAMCKVTGHSVDTFDGMVLKYKTCNHILARNRLYNKWSIEVRKNCNVQNTVCKNVLTIKQKNTLTIYTDLTIGYQNNRYSISQANYIGTLLQEFLVIPNGDRDVYFKSLLYNFGIVFDVLGNIQIIMPGEFNNKVEGLCGRYNGIMEDDTTKPNGELVYTNNVFGASWMIPGLPSCGSKTCPNKQTVIEMCHSNTSIVFPLNQCFDVANADTCTDTCIESMCSCLETGLSLESCRCEALNEFKKQCQALAPTINLRDWRRSHNCSEEICDVNEQLNDRYNKTCERTCINSINDCTDQKHVEYSDCYCKPGYVRGTDGKCIKPEECKDCICEGYGDPHYITFDGTNYEFQGNCTYTAVRGTHRNFRQIVFEVLVRNGNCAPNLVCIEEITILYENREIKLIRNGNTISTYLDDIKINNFPYYISWLNIENTDDKSISVDVVPINLQVQFFNAQKFIVKVSSQNVYYYDGLCGNCNRDKNDDLSMRNGSITNNIRQFVNSWLVNDGNTDIGECMNYNQRPGCNTTQCASSENDPCAIILHNSEFFKCHPVVDPTPYIEACRFDICYNNNPEGKKCDTIANYAQACRMKDICIDWRSDTLCPYTCPSGKQYRSCGYGCDLTCRNYQIYNNNPAEFCKFEKREGCYCPTGMVEEGNQCFEPEDCRECKCHAWGDPHYTTYDQNVYDFQGVCWYVASQGSSFVSNSTPNFKVLVENVNCTARLSPVSCTKSILILYENNTIHLFRLLHGEEYWAESRVNNQLIQNYPSETNWYRIDRVVNKTSITVRIPNVHLDVTFYRANSPSTGFIISTKSWYKLEGLCGNCNNNVSDDYTIRNGSIITDVQDFAYDWLESNLPPGFVIPTNCSKPVPPIIDPPFDPYPECELILEDKFKECHEVILPGPIIDTCKMDFFNNPPEDITQWRCDYASNYADMCRGQSICLNWRNETFCPMSCNNGQIYQSCTTECRSSCFSQYNNSSSCHVTLTEGCYCPDGLVLDNEECILPEGCTKCNKSCESKLIPAGYTTGMISETRNGSRCINDQISNLRTCEGECPSDFVYSSAANAFGISNSCCSPSSYEARLVTMRCENGVRYNKIVMALTDCSCESCSLN